MKYHLFLLLCIIYIILMPLVNASSKPDVKIDVYNDPNLVYGKIGEVETRYEFIIKLYYEKTPDTELHRCYTVYEDDTDYVGSKAMEKIKEQGFVEIEIKIDSFDESGNYKIHFRGWCDYYVDPPNNSERRNTGDTDNIPITIVDTKTYVTLKSAEDENKLLNQQISNQSSTNIITVIAVFIGGLIAVLGSFFAQWYLFNKNLKKERAERVYAPLYNEIRSILNNIKDFFMDLPNKEWLNIKENHIGFLIHKYSIERDLETLYEEKIREFRDFIYDCKMKLQINVKEDLENRIDKTKLRKEGKTEEWLKPQGFFMSMTYIGNYILSGKIPNENRRTLNEQFNKIKSWCKLNDFDTIDDYLEFLMNKKENKDIIETAKSEQYRIIYIVESLLKVLEKEKKI